MTLRIMGIDPGVANCGYAGLYTERDEESVHYGKVWASNAYGVWKTPTEWNDRDRMDYLGEQLRICLTDNIVDAVGIEGWTFMGGRGKQESQMPALIEHLYMTCKNVGVRAFIYENKEWKKKTLGIGGANKAQVQHYVSRHVTTANEKMPTHVWDSLGICLAVLQDI